MIHAHNRRMRGRPRWLRARGLAAGLVSVTAATAFLATTGAASGAAQAFSPPTPVGAAGIVPAGSALIGTLPSSTTISLDVVLKPRDAAALSSYATAVSTPGSPLYHAYIARGQFAGMFGPTSATISSAYATLRSAGLHPGAISSDHLSIPVTATAGEVESAFGVRMSSYRLAGGGVGFANRNVPRLPAAMAANVQAIIGLDNLTKERSFATAPSKASARMTRSTPTRPAGPAGLPTGGPQPCASASALQASGGLTADELAYSYEFSPLYKANKFGQGVTVGIVEFGEPNLPSDIQAYQSCYGTHTKVSYDKVDGFHQTGPGAGEATLDIENVIGLAPKTNIIVYQAPNTGQAAYDIYKVMVDQDKARVISESYGLCEFYQDPNAANAVTTLYLQAAAQGQTIVASSGDSGSEACYDNDGVKNRLSVNFPASDPFVLGVGGTTVLNVQLPPSDEEVWNEGLASGEGAGGGGKSTFYNEPPFQSGFGIKSKVREVPDVSADADPTTGYVVYNSSPAYGGWTIIGGTSGAAPLWAALLALTDEECATSPLGWVNPAMYYVASPKVKAVVITDIGPVSGSPNNNDYTGQGGGHYAVLKGYDMATGLGSPIGSVLAKQLCLASAEPKGYRLVTANGQVYSFNAPFHGSVAHPSSKVVGIAVDPKTNGYWVATSNGHVYAFDAPSHPPAHSSSIVGITSNLTGGYLLVASNGHVFAFGAKSYGSAKNPKAKVVGIAFDRQRGGYWLALQNGQVLAFHAGQYKGKKLSDVTAIAADPKQEGYWLVTGAGDVFAFHALFWGSMWYPGVGRTIGIAGDSGTGGYWLATSNGHVAGLFDSQWHGDVHGTKSPVVGIASKP